MISRKKPYNEWNGHPEPKTELVSYNSSLLFSIDASEICILSGYPPLTFIYYRQDTLSIERPVTGVF